MEAMDPRIHTALTSSLLPRRHIRLHITRSIHRNEGTSSRLRWRIILSRLSRTTTLIFLKRHSTRSLLRVMSCLRSRNLVFLLTPAMHILISLLVLILSMTLAAATARTLFLSRMRAPAAKVARARRATSRV